MEEKKMMSITGRLRGEKPLFFCFPLSFEGEGDEGGEDANPAVLLRQYRL